VALGDSVPALATSRSKLTVEPTMKHKVTLPWNAAAWRQSTYEPRVRKVHGPVGEPLVSPWNETAHDSLQRHACLGCGYHVCSCETPKRLARSELYARKYGAGVPVPAEPTLCETPKPEPREYEYCDCHHMVLRRDCTFR